MSSNRNIMVYVVTLLIVITLNFFIPRLMPGDPFTFLSGIDGEITVNFSDEEIEKYKTYYGLDQPLLNQYASYITSLIQGDLGYSIYYKKNVTEIIFPKLKWSLTIVIIAIVISMFIGSILGCLSAWYKGLFIDRALYTVMIVISEIPAFIIGLVLLFFVAIKVDVIPIAGGMTPFMEYENGLEKVTDLIMHGVLPVSTLILVRLGDFYLIARNSMIMVISKPYMQTARAKGLNRNEVLFKHALKNALIPILAKLQLSLASVFSASILVENVFNYPGIGRLIREAVLLRDYVLIQGIFLLIMGLVMGLNIIAESLFRILDPRIKEGKNAHY